MAETFYDDLEMENDPTPPIELEEDNSDNEFDLGYPFPPPGTKNMARPRHGLYSYTAPREGLPQRPALAGKPSWLNQPAVMPPRQGSHDTVAGAGQRPVLPGINGCSQPSPSSSAAAAMRTVAFTDPDPARTPTTPATSSARTAVLPEKRDPSATSAKAAPRKARINWNSHRNEILVRQVLCYCIAPCTAATAEQQYSRFEMKRRAQQQYSRGTAAVDLK